MLISQKLVILYLIVKVSVNHDINIKLNNSSIVKINSCVYLGIHIDDRLKWNIHVDSIYNGLVKYTSIFFKLRFILPSDVLKNMYFSLVHSRLLYGIEIYGNADLCVIDKLIKLNNRLLRTLQGKPMDYPVYRLYMNYDTLPIPVLYKFKVLKFMFMFNHHKSLLPSVFHDYFHTNSFVHQYNTRNKNDFHVYSCMTKFGSKSLLCNGPQLWNELPVSLKANSSLSTFEKLLKAYLRNASY